MSGHGLSIMSVTPASPRRAATFILLRDSERGLETMLIEPHPDLSFAAGARVFPGGCLSGDDHTDGGDGDLPLRIAAIRECFEECGILLARGCAREHQKPWGSSGCGSEG